MANTIGFGRRSGVTDRYLSDSDWGAFQAGVEYAVERAGGNVIFRGDGDGVWDGVAEQAACVVFLDGDRANLEHRLSVLCARYEQDAIAVSWAESTFVHAGTCRKCGEPFDTAAGWALRHSDADGEDVHADCCTDC